MGSIVIAMHILAGRNDVGYNIVMLQHHVAKARVFASFSWGLP